MKKYIYFLLIAMTVTCCSDDYEEYIAQETEDTELAYYLSKAIEAAYITHQWMEEDSLCKELDCCWEYVPNTLRIKYESGVRLSVKEMEDIITGIESSPSYLDTLDEYDAFVDLYYYKKYGKEWFEPWIDTSEDDYND